MRATPRTVYYVGYSALGTAIAEFATPDAAFFDMKERSKKYGYRYVMWNFEGKERRVRATADAEGARWLPVK